MFWAIRCDGHQTIVRADSMGDAFEEVIDHPPPKEVSSRQAYPEEVLEAVVLDDIDHSARAFKWIRHTFDLSRGEFGRRMGLPIQRITREGRSDEIRCRTWERWETGENEPGGEATTTLLRMARAMAEARDDEGFLDGDKLQSELQSQLDTSVPSTTS
jgi:DNA-binding transcriptional regulator YiaG